MTQKTQDLTTNLVEKQKEEKVTFQVDYQQQGMELKKNNSLPQITLSGLSLCLLCPVLLVAHLYVANLVVISTIQFIFVTLLVAFIFNYIFIIRKHEILPFLQQPYDNQLKLACVLAFAGLCCSFAWGWNGSGGLIFAIFWEKIRGNKMGALSYLYALIIIGSLLMEKNFTIWKLVEFIPGILFGIANSIIFTLKDSSPYIVSHQFIFLTSMCLPMVLPLNHLHVPNLYQWIVMIIMGFSMLLTVLLTVKLMQGERVSIVMAVMSGIIMLGTSSYTGSTDFIGCIIILLGLILVVKKEFLDLQF